MIAIDLPWPPKECSPNARVHHMVKHKAKKAYRTECAWLTMKAGIRRHDQDIPHALSATIIFSPPSARRADIDNMLSSVKAGIDGVVDILGIDDSKWEIALRREPPVKGGCVRIELGEA